MRYPPGHPKGVVGNGRQDRSQAERAAMMAEQMRRSQMVMPPSAPGPQQNVNVNMQAQRQQTGRGPTPGLPMPPEGLGRAGAELAIAKQNMERQQNRYIPGIQQNLREKEYLAASEKAQEKADELKIQQQDDRYANAIKLLKVRTDLNDEQRDALAREYAMDRLPLETLMPKQKGVAGLDEDELQRLQDMYYDDAKKDIEFYNTTSNALNRHAAAVQDFINGDNTGPRAVDAIYNFISNLDPGSVVKEGEAALAQSAQSYIGQLQTLLERGGKDILFTPEFQRQMMNVTASLIEINGQGAQRNIMQQVSRIKDNGLDPRRVFGSNLYEKVRGAGMLADKIEEVPESQKGDEEKTVPDRPTPLGPEDAQPIPEDEYQRAIELATRIRGQNQSQP